MSIERRGLMQIDKNRVEKVVTAIDSLAAAGEGYSFDEFCRGHNLYNENDRVRVDSIFMCCPFHADSKPSCLVSEDKRIFNCFGCGVHGNYITFVTEFDKKVLGKNTTYYQKLNELLANDSRLQAKVGFSSIYRKDHVNVRELKPLAFDSFKPNSAVMTYPELATLMIQKHCTLQQKKYAMILMQKGITADMIKREIFSDNDRLGTSSTKNISSNSDMKYSMDVLSKE